MTNRSGLLKRTVAESSRVKFQLTLYKTLNRLIKIPVCHCEHFYH